MVDNLLKILAKKGRYFTRAYKCHSLTNVVGESISSITCGIFIVKQLGKDDFSCDFFYHRVNMIGRKCFYDQLNRML